jgi:hypothetical protein
MSTENKFELYHVFRTKICLFCAMTFETDKFLTQKLLSAQILLIFVQTKN